MKELLKDLYSIKGYNCAETMLRVANKEFNLKLDENSLKTMKGFGGGLYEEDLCGAISGGIAALSIIYFENPLKLKEKVIGFKLLAKEKLGSIDCKYLKKNHRQDDNGCLDLIYKTYEILQFIKEKR